jgi:hypothetical protein
VDYRLLLEYLRVTLSAPPIVGVVVLVFFRMFKTQIGNLIDRIKQLNWPGGGAVFGSQKRKEQEEIASNPQAPTPGASGQQVTLPQNFSLTSQQIQQVVQLIQSERANAALWEYRYLNFYLVRSTQAVLDWLAASPQAPSVNLVDSYLQPFVVDANERKAILDALQKHHLITVSAGLIEVTPKGREYLQWRGPLPPIGAA